MATAADGGADNPALAAQVMWAAVVAGTSCGLSSLSSYCSLYSEVGDTTVAGTVAAIKE